MPRIDENALNTRIERFLLEYRTQMQNVSSHLTNVFEAVCFVLVVRHYENSGYALEVQNLYQGRFRFKFSTRGHPWNYSYFVVKSPETNEALFEIRHNLKVVGAWANRDIDDELPLFAVDVAVVKAGSVPKQTRGTRATSEIDAANEDLITFAEVKKLVAYPMLMAQFLGIVHELQPQFLRVMDVEIPADFLNHNHPPPILFTSEHVTPGTRHVIQTFRRRGLNMLIIENVDVLSDEQLLARIREDVQGIFPVRIPI